jgi:DNA-binding response OmpR family regulator
MKKKVLVVDDEVSILRVIEIILSSNNYEVEAISKWEYLPYSVEYFKPDLILLDVFLGGADGMEICKQLKSSKETAQIPVIIFSAQNFKDVSGCKPDAFLAKPFDMVTLLETIENNLHKQKSNTEHF